jgi:hypothetical protein
VVVASLVWAAVLVPASAGITTGPDWLLVSASSSPPARDAQAMAYDSARGRVVLFAGANENHAVDFGDTWEWDGTSWLERSPAVSPIPRFGHAMAYDAARARVVLFGGYDFFSGAPLADTWEWDGNTWVETTPETSPPARFGPAMAYDSKRERIVLFGGAGAESDLGDTWEWDGSAWTERTSEASPPAREYCSMAYDSARGRTVLFGGDSGSTYFGDTWEWDGTSWVERLPVTGPPGRTWQSLAFDDARGRTVLFGGSDGISASNDTWEWDGEAWIEVTPVDAPSPRVVASMVFDHARNRITLFAGFNGRVPLADTWVWNGSAWTEKTPATSPPARSNHAAAYDDVRRRTVVFGGYGGGPFFADTWEWDGSRWSKKTPAVSPPSRIYPAMAFDSARGKMVLFGGYGQRGPVADTWEWDGTSWVRMTPATSPSPRHGHGMVYDAARGRVLLFGGSNGIDWFADTWEWDGTNWVEVTPETGPGPRYRLGMAYDSARERVVLYGGADAAFVVNDTWEWDGTSWEVKTPETAPPYRWSHAMAYDAERGRCVTFAGSDGSSLTSETWEWDGTDWTQQVPASIPAAVFHHTMTYDGVSRRVLLFGGFNGTYLSDTWAYGSINVCGHADRVVAFTPGSGNASASADAALGEPDYLTVSTGIGGGVDLGFDRAARNGEGTDLVVHSLTDQSFRVAASDDGINFAFLRDCPGGECQLELGEAGLSVASYLRLTALAPDAGIELDAVSVIHAPPASITCPASVEVECQAAGSALISIPPATAGDSCAGVAAIVNDYNAGGADASGSYPLGQTTVTFTADDGAGSVATCSTSITVSDTTPPVVTVQAGPADLRPANHTMRPVHFTVTAVDACDPSPVVILQSVTSSEPDDAPTQWDGGTTGDVSGVSAGTPDFDVFLRAECDGRGSGRTYGVSYLATDASGNAGTGVGSVKVYRELRRPPPPFERQGRK